MSDKDKCGDLDKLFDGLAEGQKDFDAEIERVAEEHGGWYDQNEEAGRWSQALRDKINAKTTKMAQSSFMSSLTNREQYIMNQDEIRSLLKKHFKGSSRKRNERNREKALLVEQLKGLMADHQFDEMFINGLALQSLVGPDQEALTSIGEPVKKDNLTGNIDISTLPLESLRVMMGEVRESFRGSMSNDMMTSLSTRLKLEWLLPDTIVKLSGSPAYYNFHKRLQSVRNREKALNNTFTEPLSTDKPAGQTIVHSETGIKKFEGLKRHKAGMNQFVEFLDNFYPIFNSLDSGQIRDSVEMWEIINDYRRGQIFFRTDKDHFGEMWAYGSRDESGENFIGRDKPSPKTNKNGDFKRYPNGDIMRDWVGQSYTMEQQEENKRNKKNIPYSWHITPYRSSTGQHVKLTKKHAQMFDALNQQLDEMFDEIYDVMDDSWSRIATRLQKLVDSTDRKLLKDPNFPDMLKSLIMRVDSINQVADPNEQVEIKDLIQQHGKIQRGMAVEIGIDGTSQPNRTLFDANGDSVEVRQYRRYNPTQYHMAEIPNAILGALENLDREIDGLTIAVESADTKQEKMGLLKRTQTLMEAKAGIQRALDKFEHSDLIDDIHEEHEVFMMPFEKHFKTVKDFIPAKYIRRDKNVWPQYIKSLVHNLTNTELMVDLLEAYLAEPSELFKDHMVNQYRKATGSIDAKGSFMGYRWSTREMGVGLGKIFGKSNINPYAVRKFFLQSKRYMIGANLSGFLQGAQQLPSHINKITNVGYDNWLNAYVDSQKAENIKLMYDRGVFSFEEVIENMMLNQSDDAATEATKKVIRDLEQDIKKANSGEDKYALQNRLKKIKQIPQVTLLQKFAQWAITGQVPGYKTDSTPLKAFKTAMRAMNPFSLSVTERNLRGTTYMIGINGAVSFGYDRNSKQAHDLGIWFMNQTDMYLGAEGVGDRFGNDLMQFFNLVSIWKTQKMAYDWRSLKHMFRSFTPDPVTGKGKPERVGIAMYNMMKYSMLTMAGPASILLGGAGAVATGVLNPSSLNSLFGLALIGGGMTAGWTAQQWMGIGTNQREMLRLANPKGSKGLKEFWLHMGMSTISQLILFSSIASGWATSGVAMGILAAMRSTSYRTNAGSFVGALASPLYNTMISLLIVAARALDDEEESKNDRYKDWMRVVSNLTGLGGAFMLTVLMAFLDKGENQKLPTKGKKRTDGPKDDIVDMLQIEALEQLPLFDHKEILKKSGEGAEDLYDWGTRPFRKPLYEN